jgi:hypothetical protein
MTKVRVFIVCLLATLCAGLAHADGLTVNDVNFTATVTSITATLNVKCTNTAVCGGWYLGDLTLKGFTFTGTPTLGIADPGYTLVPGGQNNSGVGGSGGCNGTQTGSAVCWDVTVPMSTTLGGGTHTFTAHIAGGVPGRLDVQATAYDNIYGFQWGGGKVLAVSSPIPGTNVPEPNALLLLSSGLVLFLGLLAIYRARLQCRVQITQS